ncbi:MAG: apolipoprotein N-acyltransferase [Calditrichaeota bacterium]|nr:MAG: apolipoprotein N-acyltransferase [Calditrichota bacterium]
MQWNELKPVLLAAVGLALAYPPVPAGFLVPFVLAYWFRHLQGLPPGTAFARGYLFGVVLGTLTLYWIAVNTIAGAVLAILINALQYAVLAWGFAWLYRRRPTLAWASLPLFWTALEFLRHFSDLRFNWLSLAYTQTYYLPFIQFIEWTGYLGLTALLVSLAVLWHRIQQLRKPLWREGALFLLLIALPLAYGTARMKTLRSQMYPGIRAGLVQPNVNPWHKWEPSFQDSAYQMLEEATKHLVSQNPGVKLVVWPETATPFFLRHETAYLHRLQHLVDSLKLYLITGTPDYRYFPAEKDVHTYNAAFFFAPQEPGFQAYYKMALVPVAETMPFKSWLPFLRHIDVGGGDFFPGKEFTVFLAQMPFRAGHFQNNRFVLLADSTAQSFRLGISTVICFESVFPHLVRRFVQRGARLLTIITNDGWFGPTSGPQQHARYAVLRAIENRVSIVRCANTGVSLFVDMVGSVFNKLGYNRAGTAVGDLPIYNHPTFYTRHGDWPGWLSLLFTPLVFSMGVRR